MESFNVQLNKKLKKSYRNCCVVGCKSVEGKVERVHFYSFPNRAWESERKKKWINALRRTSLNGKPWAPTSNSRICSLHFCGGEKSNNPLSNAYNPSIFASIYNKQRLSKNSQRTERLKARNKKLEPAASDLAIHNNSGTCEVSMLFDMNPIVPNQENESFSREISVQTDPILEGENFSNDEECSFLYCYQDGATKTASTQTSIVLSNNSKVNTDKRVIIPEQKDIKNVRVGPNTPSFIGFSGFEDIKNDGTMKQLGSIKLSFFHILLKFIQLKEIRQLSYYRTLDAPNRLLLFLMKMKLGLSFAAIGCFFHISKTSSSTIFFAVLKTLHFKTKTWIFWPSREAVKETMPPTFKKYPCCRAIIDCTELICDTPPTIEQRIQMYSSYKSSFSVKYLLCISPSGMITFISKGYGGRATDGFIVNHSGFINLVEPGDQIMADKGFPQIKTALLERQCVLVMPPFAMNPQFTSEKVQEGYSIALVRIHVERAIQRVKIFEKLKHIPVELLNYIDKIMYIACVLAKNKEPFIQIDNRETE